MKKISIFLFLIFLLSVYSFAQDSTYARKIIRDLSSPEMFGRGHSYKGDSIAAQYLANEMRNLGLLPLQVDYLQRYSYDCYSFEGPISLFVNGKKLVPYSQYRVFQASINSKNHQTVLNKAKFKRQMNNGIWVYGVDQLDTYSPISQASNVPLYVEILESALPKKVKKIDLNLPIHYRENYQTQNVVGYVPGVIDSMVVFVGHYDHCGTMGDDVVFYGAHDNASGIAAVMDIARISTQRKPYYTMVFMLFSGEESGLKGSKYASMNPLVDYRKIKLLCNLDLFCGGDDGLMFFNANSENTKLYYDKLVELNKSMKVAKEIRPRNNSANSDHYYFSQFCPSIYLLSMGQPYGGYHDPKDICESCGLSHYNDYLSLILKLIDFN